MQKPPIARGSATRTANMIKRREHILSCAGELIAKVGYDEFTLGQLAEAANVTVPTIHNLIGKKSQIFERLVADMVERIKNVLSELEQDDPILAVETFIDNLLDLYCTDENLYKAAFVAGERAHLFEHELPSGIYARSLEIVMDVCNRAVEQGYLQGEIDIKQLSRQLFACQRMARQDWMHGYIDLDTYRKHVLSGMFITLAADATPDYHQRLLNKIEELNQS